MKNIQSPSEINHSVALGIPKQIKKMQFLSLLCQTLKVWSEMDDKSPLQSNTEEPRPHCNQSQKNLDKLNL